MVLEQISRSCVEEDIYHAYDMLFSSLSSKFKAEEAFILSCVAHDLERSLPCRTRPDTFSDYDEFKNMHQKRSAEAFLKLTKHILPREILKKAQYLISNHEIGPTNDSEILELRYLDTKSFLEVNAAYFLKREGEERLKKRILWGLNRLNPSLILRLKEEVAIKSEKVRSVFLQAVKSFPI